MYNLPHPLTEKSLAGLILDRRYRDRRDPAHKAYRDFVTKAYRSYYGEGAQHARAAGSMVHVRGYTRVVDGQEQHVQAYERRGPWSNRSNPNFRQKIAEAEMSAVRDDNGYGDRNKDSNALGRYQLTPIALDQIKWRNNDGSWTEKARQHGVESDQQFLDNPEAQEDAMDEYLRDNERQADSFKLTKRVGDKVSRPGGNFTVTLGGLMAAAHRHGARKTAKYFAKLDSAKRHGQRPTLSKEEGQIEKRLRDFQNVPYTRLMSPRAQPQRNGR
jgi:hypothetical protein